MFSLKDCGGFRYWFAHWKAFNKVAIKCHKWKFKYLFHDIEKPFLMLFWYDFERVQRWHVEHNSHHPQKKPFEKIDLEGMLIDWESSRLTKSFAPLSARQFYENNYKGKNKFTEEQQKKIEEKLDLLGL